MTTPENPFAGSEVPRTPQSPAESKPADLVHTGIAEPFPSWGMLDILIVLGITIGAVFFSTFLAALVATGLPVFRHASTKQLLTDARVLVPAQTFAYLIALFFIYRIVAGYKHLSFSEAIHWRWPRLRWPAFLLGGFLLAMAVVGLQRILPIPKQMPIEQMFSTTTGAWMMAFLGVAIAPLMEEIFFRGLLFPVLARNLNVTAAILTTGVLFALIHASQLGSAWAPVLILLIVGVVLTMVRWLAESLAAAVLVHVGYNATLFGMLYAATDSFRHLERIGH